MTYTEDLEKVISYTSPFNYRGVLVEVKDGWFEVFGVLVENQEKLDDLINSAMDGIRKSLVNAPVDS